MNELSYLREVYETGLRMRKTTVVDDDFPEMMHYFDCALHQAEEFINTTVNCIEELKQDTGSWAEKTFPKSNELSVLKHMQAEFNELIEAVNPKDKAEEAADVFLLLLHYCYKNKIDLYAAAQLKLSINKSRQWETEINDEGYFKHTN